jgi:hypothetical protein
LITKEETLLPGILLQLLIERPTISSAYVVAAYEILFAAMLHVHQHLVIYAYELVYLLVPRVHPLYLLAHALELGVGSYLFQHLYIEASLVRAAISWVNIYNTDPMLPACDNETDISISKSTTDKIWNF